MNPNADQEFASGPSDVDIARLMHETGLSADDALKALQAAHAARVRWESAQSDREREAIPQPTEWPALLDDLYRLIVKAKDAGNNQPRLENFLRHQLEVEQAKIREDLQSATKSLAEMEEEIKVAAKKGVARVKESYPGTPTTLQAAQRLKDYIAQQSRRLLTAEGVDSELKARLQGYKSVSFDQPTWNNVASKYREWWKAENTENKRFAASVRSHMRDTPAQLNQLDPKLAGAVRKAQARKGAAHKAAFEAHPEAPPHKSKKRLTEVQSLTKLHAAQEKELAKPVRKKGQPPLLTSL